MAEPLNFDDLIPRNSAAAATGSAAAQPIDYGSSVLSRLPQTGREPRAPVTPPAPPAAPIDRAAALNFDDLVPKSEPGVGGTLYDVDRQARHGFNRGLSNMLQLPGEGMAWLAEKTGSTPEQADVWRLTHQSTPHDYKNPPEGISYGDRFNDWIRRMGESGDDDPAKTTAGRYARTGGEFIGGAVVPEAGIAARAKTLATAERSVVKPGLVQAINPANAGRALRNTAIEGAGEMVRHPMGYAGVSLASAVGGGAAQQAAADADLPPWAQAWSGMAGGFIPGAVVSGSMARAAATRRALEAQRDLQAFKNLDVRPFGPAFNEGPVREVAKGFTETALVGPPLKNALDKSLEGARNASGRIAQELGPDVGYHQLGTNLQEGLENYSRAGVSAVDPDRLRALGIEPFHDVPTSELTSQGARGRAQAADQIRQANGEAPQPFNAVAAQRRRIEDLNPNEVGAILSAPENQTSFAAKAEAMYRDAWDRVPTFTNANGNANAGLLTTPNTAAAVRNIRASMANDIAGQTTVNDALMDALRSSNTNFTLDNLRAIRTEVGRRLGNMSPLQNSLDRSQLNALYAGLSQDINVGLRDYANRALIASRLPATDPRYIAPALAQRAQTALPAMQRADQYFATGRDRIDNFMKVVKASTPEAAARQVETAALGQGKGNLDMLRSAHAALAPDQWNEISGQVLRNLGAPSGSARGTAQELGFSVSSFLTRWNNMTPQAKSLLFGGGHAQAINDLERVVRRLAGVEAMSNTSRSATTAMNVGGAVGIGGDLAAGFATGHPEAAILWALGGVGGGRSLSKLMSTERYARWMAGYAQLRSNVIHAANPGVDGELARHVAKLGLMTKLDPELRPIYEQAKRDTDELERQKQRQN